jgi:NIMA (never in mitosis gene a)-related kinase
MKSDIWSLGCVIYEMAALRPPFQAADLQGLYKKVKAGVFDRIPTMYSNELSAIIGMMLKVHPKLRPSVDDILANSIVAKNYKEGLLTPAEMEEERALLQTIKFNPFNLRALKDKLPKSNYDKEDSKMNIIPESPKSK